MTTIDLETAATRERAIWDWTVRISVTLWYLLICMTVVRQIVTYTGSFGPLEIARLLSKLCLLSFIGMAAWLTIVRAQPIARARGIQPRVSALLGTNLVFFGILFLNPVGDLGIGLYSLSAILIVIGNGFCAFAITHLGRSFSVMAEARKVVSSGPYAIVRHPLYLAEIIAYVGVLIQYWSIAALLLVIVQFGFQIKRMLNEEVLLRETFADYGQYMMRTARLIPGVW
jgi:protein-S-isoprenylcysteine O-methyltransferase Ste14